MVAPATARLRRPFALFVLGLLAGGILFLLIYGIQMQNLRSELATTYYGLNQRAKEIARLQDELSRLARRGASQRQEEEVIRTIAVEIVQAAFIGSEAIQEKLERALSPIVGKSMRWMSQYPDLIDLILRGQIFTLDEMTHTRVRISLRYAAFHRSTLRVWVHAEEVRQEEAPSAS